MQRPIICKGKIYAKPMAKYARGKYMQNICKDL